MSDEPWICTAPCQTASDRQLGSVWESLIQEIYQQHLPTVASTAPNSLWSLWGRRVGPESTIGQTAAENDAGNAILSSREWVSGSRGKQETKARRRVRQRETPSIQLCLRRRWLTQHVIALLSFRATIDPTTSSPLRVSIPARLDSVCVCACVFAEWWEPFVPV